MQRPLLEVADLVRAAGERFVEKSRGWLSGQHLKVLSAIEHCRTAALGGHLDECSNCGYRPAISYNSCRDRHCPKCQANTRERWLQARRKQLLPTRYLHAVFTLPHQLSRLTLQNKWVIYSLLLRTSAETLLEVARDPKRLGAEIGFFSVLHTWNQKLQHHSHVHCVLAAGGLSPNQGRWIEPRYDNFFLPTDVLAEVFRGKFVDALREAFAEGRLRFSGRLRFLSQPRAFSAFLRTLFRNKWVVYLKPPFGGPEQVLRYLGRYTHRVALSNHRLVSFADGQVTFRWRDSAHGNQQRLMSLAVDEFLRRFLLHLLPPRFIRIRYYGFLAHRKRAALLPLCRRLIVRVKPSRTIFLGDDEPARSGWDCPRCGGRMRVVERSAPLSCAFVRRPHSPPPDATTFPIASHSVASARTALVCLHDLPQPVPLAAATLSAPKPLASPCDHRSRYSSPAPLSPSQGSRPRIRTVCPSDSKRIDSVLPQKASFKSSYRKRSLCVGGLLSHSTACDMTLRYPDSNPQTSAM